MLHFEKITAVGGNICFNCVIDFVRVENKEKN